MGDDILLIAIGVVLVVSRRPGLEFRYRAARLTPTPPQRRRDELTLIVGGVAAIATGAYGIVRHLLN